MRATLDRALLAMVTSIDADHLSAIDSAHPLSTVHNAIFHHINKSAENIKRFFHP